MPPSVASEAVLQNKEAGAVAAFDRIPFSHVSANFTYNLDNCVSFYLISVNLLYNTQETQWEHARKNVTGAGMLASTLV